MPYEIVRNDITKMEVDAIVNTANPRPVIGAGTDYAIHQAAGPELLESRKKIGNIAIGQSVATPAYKLHAKYVLHTVSPAWKDGNHHEAELLRKAYDSALALALKLKCKSVAFPLMAAGSYGFPHDTALIIASQAISEFALHHRMQIYLVVFNGKAFSAAGGLFANLRSYIDDNYVAEQNKIEYALHRRRDRELEEHYKNQAVFYADYIDDIAQYDEDLVLVNGTQMMPSEDAASSGMDLSEFLQQSEITFTEYLFSLLKESGEKDSVIYHRARMSRQRFNNIISDKYYQPKKGTAIQLAIGLRLSMPQTQTLLRKAGYQLTRSSKMDLVIQYFIERKTYDVDLINDALYDCNLPLLKTS